MIQSETTASFFSNVVSLFPENSKRKFKFNKKKNKGNIVGGLLLLRFIFVKTFIF